MDRGKPSGKGGIRHDRPMRSRHLATLPAPLAAVLLWCASAQAAEPPQLGKDPLPAVIAAMTVEEKVGLVMGTGMDLPGLDLGPQLQAPPVGPVPNAVAGAGGTTLPVPRLGIPALILADGPAGLRISPLRPGAEGRSFHATAFPVATLLASSWDTALVERVGAAMGAEARDYGIDVLLAPALNIHRNPLGGRNYEYYSEDPLLSGKLAAAMVRGLQSRGIGATPKHFVANDHEWNRMSIDVKVSQRALREVYLRPFEIALRESRPWTLMSSYNKVNGTYTSESPALLTDLLRGEWGFEGLVMSDWYGGRDPVAQLRAGNDLLQPGTAAQRRRLLDAAAADELDRAALDRSVERVLRLVLRSATFSNAPRSGTPDLAAHARLAREAAAEGMVLLKNGGALPLAPTRRRAALFGNAAYDTVIGGTGSGDVNEAYAVPLADGLAAAGIQPDALLAADYAVHLREAKARRPPKLPLLPAAPLPERTVAPAEVARAARDADFALVTLGRVSGEFVDRRREGDFELSPQEKALLAEVSKAFRARSKPVVVVLNIGGVVETASWRDLPDAILLAWQPGQEAGLAIADTLTGKVDPSGRLATTFPLRWEDVPSSADFPGRTLLGADPAATGLMKLFGDRAAEVEYLDDIWVGYRHFTTRRVPVAFPFGFGLSYTTFRYSGLTLDRRVLGPSGITASVTVTNTGRRAGREVVQLYLSAPGRSMAKPALELKAFAKTKRLAPGGSQRLSFKIEASDLASFDEKQGKWVVERGDHTLRVGASSEDIRASADFEAAP